MRAAGGAGQPCLQRPQFLCALQPAVHVATGAVRARQQHVQAGEKQLRRGAGGGQAFVAVGGPKPTSSEVTSMSTSAAARRMTAASRSSRSTSGWSGWWGRAVRRSGTGIEDTSGAGRHLAAAIGSRHQECVSGSGRHSPRSPDRAKPGRPSQMLASPLAQRDQPGARTPGLIRSGRAWGWMALPSGRSARQMLHMRAKPPSSWSSASSFAHHCGNCV